VLITQKETLATAPVKLYAAYRNSVALFTTFTGFSAAICIAGLDMPVTEIKRLGFPAYFVRYIGICKLAGLITLLFIPVRFLKEFAFGCFFMLFISAITAHIIAGSFISAGIPALLALLILSIQYYCYTLLQPRRVTNRGDMRVAHKQTAASAQNGGDREAHSQAE
jgi:DoxX-like family